MCIRCVCHSSVTLFCRSVNNYWRIAEGTHTILQIQQSACQPRQNPSNGIPPEEQRGEENVKGEMEQDGSGEHTTTYLGVTLDRTLSYKQHIHNTKIKAATRNNLLRKLSSSKWGTHASIIITTALLLFRGWVRCPVWARLAHAYKLDSELNIACRAITGCLKPTNVEELYLLSGIAPPSIRRDVCDRVEKAK